MLLGRQQQKAARSGCHADGTLMKLLLPGEAERFPDYLWGVRESVLGFLAGSDALSACLKRSSRALRLSSAPRGTSTAAVRGPAMRMCSQFDSAPRLRQHDQLTCNT